MIIDKYKRIIVSALPKEVAEELDQIKTDTEDFKSDELVEIYKENFNTLFGIIEKKYPEALAPKKRLILKARVKTRLVKKKQPRKKLLKKSEKPAAAKKAAEKKDENCEEAAKELHVIKEKRAAAAEKRAEAPKKKASTAAREKQVRAMSSVLKIKKMKEDQKAAEKFASSIIESYRSNGLETIADLLKKDLDALIQKTFDQNVVGNEDLTI